MARKADLITGLLGAGKTTFLVRYARFLMERGEQIAVIVNDHGAVSVDAMLLREELGEDVPVELVIDDGDKGCHKRRVRAKLIALAMEGARRVILEPSGVFEPEEFFDLLREPPLEQWYEPGNIIAVLEGRPAGELSEESRFLLASQLADAGAVVLSKTEGASPEEIRLALEQANAALAEFKCGRRLGEEVLNRPWDRLTEQDWARIAGCGCAFHDYERRFRSVDGFATLYFLNTGVTAESLAPLLGELFSGTCGRVMRVKGFLPGENGWVRFNATPGETELLPTAVEQRCFIVIGEDLEKEKLEKVLDKGRGGVLP